jgi:RNA polymerase sigma-70 factor (ECF subfamily)
MLERHRRALAAVALDRLGRVEVAEEIAQQAIVKAWEHRGQLREAKAAAGWLFRIAINCCVEWQRRPDRRWSSLEGNPEAGACSAPVLDEVIRRESIRDARRALEGMPMGNRVALLMHASGYSYQEIAGFLALPASTIRGRVARARSKLRRSLASRLTATVRTREESER